MGLMFTLKARIAGGEAAAGHALDVLRERTVPSLFHGITLWNLQPSGEPDVYSLDAEIEAESDEEARAAFERFRETEAPGIEGVSLYDLTTAPSPTLSPGS